VVGNAPSVQGVLVGQEVGAVLTVDTPLVFEEFFEAERDRLFGAIRLMTGDGQEAEEIVQDSFLALWERWDRVSGMDNAAGYLFRTAMNVFRSRRRRMLRAARKVLPLPTEQDPYGAADVRDEVIRGLRRLAPRQRAALVLVELLDLQSAEAASLLGVRPTTVRNLAAQGRTALRQVLESDDG
jgi:RNA polymerase sigma factor (sigma-70 family)